MELDLDHIFMHHPPEDNATIAKYEQIREAGRSFAKAIVDLTPTCADQTVAVRKVREAVMNANAAIALGGRLYLEEGRTS